MWAITSIGENNHWAKGTKS
uniref:Uncharacterized protein n=1 Tax=Arundo donax TaxID=35708 RepID=A0A0A9BVC4_ARUDO